MLAGVARLAGQIDAEARRLDPAKVALTLLMALPFLAGWLAGSLWRASWVVLAWSWTAVAVGFRSARGRPPGEPD